MMKILTRYVLWELAKVFCVTLSCMTLLLLIFGVAREAADEGLGLTQILQLIPYILPDSLRFTLPGTSLFAVSVVYGRLSANNEITAVKMLGIHPLAIVWPTLIAATLLSLSAVVMFDVALSWGQRGIQRVIVEAAEEVAYGVLARHRMLSRPQFTLSVKAVDGKRLVMPTLIFRGSQSSGDKAGKLVVTAEDAELLQDPQTPSLVLVLHNGTATGGGVRYRFPREERRLELVQAASSGPATATRLSLREIPEARRRRQAEIDEFEQEAIADVATALLTGEFTPLVNPTRQQFRKRVLKCSYDELYRLDTEPCRRWASGFGCLFFVFVGTGLAIQRKTADYLKSFFLCFGPILLVYYPLSIIAINHAREGAPSVIVWSANGVLFLWGLWLMRRVIRW